MNKSEIKLNFGCGEDKKPGFINIDWNDITKPDMAVDLNRYPYPFENNSVDFVEMSHILEHLEKPFQVMKEMHRILKPGGQFHIKVPHFSRGMTHSEHEHGFDVTFPLYFNPNFTKSGYFGVEYKLEKMELHWLAFMHLLRYMGYGNITQFILRILNKIISYLANLSPALCSRIWCFWVGGFDEIEYLFIKPKN